jgi:hypothetical protein
VALLLQQLQLQAAATAALTGPAWSLQAAPIISSGALLDTTFTAAAPLPSHQLYGGGSLAAAFCHQQQHQQQQQFNNSLAPANVSSSLAAAHLLPADLFSELDPSLQLLLLQQGQQSHHQLAGVDVLSLLDSRATVSLPGYGHGLASPLQGTGSGVSLLSSGLMQHPLLTAQHQRDRFLRGFKRLNAMGRA